MRRTLRAFVQPARVEHELQREVAFHLANETEKNIRLGFSPEEAHRRAKVDFGSVDAAKEAHRDGRGTRLVNDFIVDTRLALRTFRRNPGFAAAAIITLMLGIGANVAIFSAVHDVLLRPLPYASPDRLVMLWEENEDRGWVHASAAPANMLDWGEQVRAFSDVAGYASFATSATLTGTGEPAVYQTLAVTGNFFRLLGVRPAAGRLFDDSETWSGREPSVMITYGLWRARFHGEASLVGKTISLNGRDVRVTGVLPAEFVLPGVTAQMFRPTAWDPATRSRPFFRRAHWILPVARLRDGFTLSQANAELQTVIGRLQREYPATNTKMGGGLTPLHEFLIGDSKRPLLVLFGAVALLLLIACANVGNLLLVHASGRTQETALRLALGARASRLVRQALTESLVLAVLGGLAGCLIGFWVLRLLSVLQPAGLLPSGEVSISWPVLAYVACITVASSLLFGVAPILWSRTRAPGEAMRDGARTGGGVRVKRWADFLLVGEVAIAVVLTLGAGLLVKSFSNLARVKTGVSAEGVLTTKVSLPGVRYDSSYKIQAFWTHLTDAARALPSVASVGAVSVLPLTEPSWTSDFVARGWPAERIGVDVVHRDVLPGYFETLRVPLLKGRYIDEGDRADGEGVVVLNDAAVRQYFPNEEPVGQQVTFNRVPDSTSVWYRIVGVVGSERQGALAEPAKPEIFQPAAQRGSGTMVLVIRATRDPEALVPLLRQSVARLDPGLALADVKTMTEVVAQSSSRERFMTLLLFAFAFVGFVLALVGVYGVMARVARGRVREMGIRIALGAQASDVRWLVVRRGLTLTAAGIAIGLGVATAVAGVLRTLLYGVEPVDPLTFVVVPLILAAAAIAACWLPAARVSRSDPMLALRAE
ncbi:MAG: ABC transporter permease [Gemmatimonadota bacterium]